MITDFLKSGQVGTIELDEQRRQRTEITKRWDKLGLTEGLVGIVKENIATLYENQAKQMIREATSSENSGSFETVVFPIIRRVFSKLLANDIVSVQAMNLPVGKLFFILPVTSDRDWSDTEIEDGVTGRHTGLMGYERVDRRDGSTYNRFYLPDEAVNDQTFEIFDVRSGDVVASGYTSYDEAFADKGEGERVRQTSPNVTRYRQKSLYDLFYNDFLFDNSKGKVHIKVGEATPVILTPEGFKDADIEDLQLYADGTLRNITLKVTGFASYNAGKLTGPDGNEMDAEDFVASLKVVAADTIGSSAGTCFQAGEALHFRFVTQKYGNGIVDYGNVCQPDGCIYIEVDLVKPAKEQGATIDGFMGVELPESLDGLFKIAWCQYDSLELETEIAEVSFKLSSVTVSVTERKLRATWSPELAQDVSAFHNIDAEAELTALLSEQVAAEIDREILRDLRKLAPWKIRWDANGWRRQAGFSTNYTQKDWNQTFITKCNQISAQIHKSTLRGGANFMVVSSEISAIFDDLEYFHVSDANAESDQYNMGIEKMGSVNNRYQVFRDPYSPFWSAILGHKGRSLLDSGYIYAPYIPMQLTPTLYNPNNFAPVKGIMTRYAKKCVNNRYYGAIVADGLQTWDINELR